MKSCALLTSTLSPAAGGLSAAVPQLVRAMEEVGSWGVHVVGIEDPMDKGAAKNWAKNVQALYGSGPKALNYAPQMAQTLALLAPEVIDVQGLWTYPSLANFRHHRLTGKPYIITPHGMLDPWARDHSWWKKKAVRIFFEDRHLAGAGCLRATAELEAENFRSFGLRNPIAIVPNGVEIPTLAPRGKTLSERRRLLFLSRIHPKKGLPYLLRAWADIASDRPDWELVIAGPDEVNHTAEMQRLAMSLRAPRIVWHEAVHGEAKTSLYRSADLLVLPTHAENFGLVVAEALAHEVPVITTRNAPWKGLLDYNCGWWIDLEHDRLRTALFEATSLSRPALQEKGARGRAWMARDFGWSGIADKMLELYAWVANCGPQPIFVSR